MNCCYFIGNLTRDPELRTTQSGKSVCTFSIAVNRRQKDQDGNSVTDFVTIVTWQQLADLCAKWLRKGKKVAVTGSLQQRSYEDKEGAKRTVYEVVATEVEFLTPKEDSTGAAHDAPAPTASYGTPSPAPVQAATMFEVDEDLPF